jgi:Neuraminidase (sialidase)
MNKKALIAAILLLIAGCGIFYLVSIFFVADLNFYFSAKKINACVQSASVVIKGTSDPIHAGTVYEATTSLVLIVDGQKRNVSEIFSSNWEIINKYKFDINPLNNKCIDIYLSSKKKKIIFL